jgi:FtsP/CotA-like multicopper oxidase with cupredoxin domain
MLRAAGLGSLAAGAGALGARGRGADLEGDRHFHDHAMGAVGRVDTSIFDPTLYLRSFNFSHLPATERARFYRESTREDGSLLREYEIFAVDREIEIAPGLVFPAWTFNGQVPGPTLRATEGDRVRVRFTNQGTHPHTLHFHGWHPPAMDGSLPEHQVPPGGEFLYEFDAEPFGLHLYHCHAIPLKRHIHKGLYGVFLVDPKAARPAADEMVMVMNAFDTNFDADNEVYAVNTVGFHHMVEPIQVAVGELVRIHLVNVTEFDLINSLHLHAMFFDVYRTGTRLEPSETTDTVMLCQGERAILETRFRYPGRFMFHAHQSEFAELGWMGFFDAVAR